jgi:hypothetical protein
MKSDYVEDAISIAFIIFCAWLAFGAVANHFL